MIIPTIRIYACIIVNFEQKEWNSKEYYNSSVMKIKRIFYIFYFPIQFQKHFNEKNFN